MSQSRLWPTCPSWCATDRIPARSAAVNHVSRSGQVVAPRPNLKRSFAEERGFGAIIAILVSADSPPASDDKNGRSTCETSASLADNHCSEALHGAQ